MEILREITEINTENPPSTDELKRVQDSNTMSLSGRWETNTAVLGALAELISFGLEDDYWQTYAEQLNGLTLQQTIDAGNALLKPEQLTLVVIGDREKIAENLQQLDIGKIQLLDVNGKPIDDD
jgi:zinc protease